MTPQPRLIVPQIETERLTLRAMIPDDAPAMQQVLSHESVSRATDVDEIPYPYTLEMTERFIADAEEAAKRGENIVFAGLVRETETMITEVGLWHIDWRHLRADLGIIIRPDHWGRGYGAEALRAVIEVGFAGLGLHRLDGGCFSWNTASERMMRNCGLVEEGRRRSYSLQGDIWEDETVFGILQSERRAAGRRVIRECDPPLDSIAKEPSS